MKKLYVLRAGDVPPPIAVRRGEYLSWFQDAVANVWSGEVVEHDVRTRDPFPEFADVAGLLLTGSSHSVTERADWMLRYEDYLRDAVARDVPVLGICFGHQILAQALGGHVTKNARGREMGTQTAQAVANDELFAGLAGTFAINTTHVDSAAVLPPDARVLATTALEPHAAFAIEGKRARGVQFHPEIDGDAMRAWIDLRADLLDAEGLPREDMKRGATDCHAGRVILENFVRHFVLAAG